MPTILNTLPRNAQTLRPAGPADALLAKRIFPFWESAQDGRFVIRPKTVRDEPIKLTHQWRRLETQEGAVIDVRSADCGADCHCAGEFKFAWRD